jgi:hypothetical protein
MAKDNDLDIMRDAPLPSGIDTKGDVTHTPKLIVDRTSIASYQTLADTIIRLGYNPDCADLLRVG